MSKLKVGAGHSVATLLLNRIAAKVNARQYNVTPDQARKVASLESANPAEVSEISAVAEDITGDNAETLSETIAEVQGAEDAPTTSEVKEEYAAGLEAAAIIALASADVGQYHAAARVDVSTESGLVGLLPDGSGGAQRYVPSFEAFDRNSLGGNVAQSITYNLLAPRQDEFGETLFPTIVATPDQAAYKAVVDRVMVYQGAIHKLDADPAKFEKRNVLEAFRDPEVLKNDATVLVPFVDPAGTNADKFVADTVVPTQAVKVDKIEVDSRPLVFNKKIDLIGISTHPGLLQAQVMDQSDSVDSFVRLARVYAKVTHDGKEAVVSFSTLRSPLNQFLKTPEGNGRQTALRFEGESLRLDKNSVVVSGDATVLDPIRTAELRVRLAHYVNGTLNLETGSLQLSPGNVEVASVVDVDNAPVALTNAAVAGLTVELVGFELDARRTNSNRRSRGLLMDNDRFEEQYEVGLLPPISVHKPTAPYDYGRDVEALVTTTHMYISTSAVTALFNYADTLKANAEGYNGIQTADSYTGGAIQGIGRMLVTPHYEEHTIDLDNVVNSVSSKDKMRDIQGFFIARINEIAHRMLQLTGYRPALEMLNGKGARPKLVVATDEVLPQFIMIQGDDRTAGISMDFKQVTSPDMRMYDHIFLTFITNGDGLRPLNFGNLIWIPELVSTVPVNRGGATVEETMVQPRFRHICNLPVLAKIKVLNLDKVVGKRVPLDANITDVTP